MSVQDLVTEVEVALVEGERLDEDIFGPQVEPLADCRLGFKNGVPDPPKMSCFLKFRCFETPQSLRLRLLLVPYDWGYSHVGGPCEVGQGEVLTPSGIAGLIRLRQLEKRGWQRTVSPRQFKGRLGF